MHLMDENATDEYPKVSEVQIEIEHYPKFSCEYCAHLTAQCGSKRKNGLLACVAITVGVTKYRSLADALFSHLQLA